jgi:hypothetical protein
MKQRLPIPVIVAILLALIVPYSIFHLIGPRFVDDAIVNKDVSRANLLLTLDPWLVNGTSIGFMLGYERPLHLASFYGDRPMVELLIKKGAQINSRNSTGQTALHMASDQGHINVAEFLISRGAPVDSRGDGNETPLHKAAGEGRNSMVTFLIGKGADINARNSAQCLS